MKNLLIVGAVLLSLGGCTTLEQSVATGAAIGGVAGAVVTGNVGGAVVGAAVGGTVGYLVGRVDGQTGMCYYKDKGGRMVKDVCPAGY